MYLAAPDRCATLQHEALQHEACIARYLGFDNAALPNRMYLAIQAFVM